MKASAVAGALVGCVMFVPDVGVGSLEPVSSTRAIQLFDEKTGWVGSGVRPEERQRLAEVFRLDLEQLHRHLETFDIERHEALSRRDLQAFMAGLYYRDDVAPRPAPTSGTVPPAGAP